MVLNLANFRDFKVSSPALKGAVSIGSGNRGVRGAMAPLKFEVSS